MLFNPGAAAYKRTLMMLSSMNIVLIAVTWIRTELSSSTPMLRRVDLLQTVRSQLWIAACF